MRSLSRTLTGLVTLIIIAAVLAVVGIAPRPAHAQITRTTREKLREVDSLRHVNDSLARVEDSLVRRVAVIRRALAAPAPAAAATISEAATLPAPRASAGARLLAVGLAPLAYVAGAADRDPGGYGDSYRPQPDKVAHAAVSALITQSLAARAGPLWAAAGCVAAGAAYELGQRRDGGYGSRYDMAYNAGGCVAGLALHALVSRGR